MTVLSLDLRQAMTAESTDAVAIFLFTFIHDDLPEPGLISSDRTERLSLDPLTYGTVSRGDTFLWVPVSVVLPGDDDQMAPQLRIVIDAVDRRIFDVIRASATPAKCKMEMVLETSLDTVEMVLDNFEVASAPYDESQVTLVMSQESFWSEPWPYGRFTPTWYPGLHR